MTPIAASCSREFTAYHESGVRPLDRVRWIVLHSTEGPTARGAARYFTSPESGGSAHLVVDDADCYRTLLNTQVPWAAPGANEKGFHIEQAGYAKWSTDDWLEHDTTIRRAAYKTALHAGLFAIPLRWVGAAGLKKGMAGVTTHAACTLAFSGGSGRPDPGPNWPKTLFMSYAKKYAAEL